MTKTSSPRTFSWISTNTSMSAKRCTVALVSSTRSDAAIASASGRLLLPASSFIGRGSVRADLTGEAAFYQRCQSRGRTTTMAGRADEFLVLHEPEAACRLRLDRARACRRRWRPRSRSTWRRRPTSPGCWTRSCRGVRRRGRRAGLPALDPTASAGCRCCWARPATHAALVPDRRLRLVPRQLRQRCGRPARRGAVRQPARPQLCARTSSARALRPRPSACRTPATRAGRGRRDPEPASASRRRQGRCS